jgi:hypothetical protein
MATDRTEAAKRGQQRQGGAKRHPYAAIDHRVIDSEAYADLSFSARALLVQLARQLSAPNNNGRLHAVHSVLSKFGFSENTITRGIAELIAHGFVYRARSGGFHQGAAQYAVTWLPITEQRDGLFFQGFRTCAWRDWEPSEKKLRSPNLGTDSRNSGGLTAPTAANLAADSPPKNEDIELMPVHSVSHSHGQWVKAYLDRLATHGPQFVAHCSVVDHASL